MLFLHTLGEQEIEKVDGPKVNGPGDVIGLSGSVSSINLRIIHMESINLSQKPSILNLIFSKNLHDLLSCNHIVQAL